MCEPEAQQAEPLKDLDLLGRLEKLVSAKERLPVGVPSGFWLSVCQEAGRQRLSVLEPLKGPGWCAVCKGIRLDNDPTGVTCGNQTCIDHVASSFGNFPALEKHGKEADAMKVILEKVGDLLGSVPIASFADAGKLCEGVEEAVCEIKRRVLETAKLLNIAVSETTTIVDFLEMVGNMMNDISVAVSKLEGSASPQTT